MGTTLTTMRARLRKRLDDDGSIVWTDAELQEHIEAALRDLSVAIPQQTTSTVATTNGSRDLSITADRIGITAVEFPVGNFPRSFQPFSVWGDTITMSGDLVGNGANAKIYYTIPHTIGGSGTLPIQHDEILLLGAAWLACEQQAADVTNAINDAGNAAPRDWGSLARTYRVRYQDRKARAQGVRVSAAVPASQPFKRQQNVDPGP